MRTDVESGGGPGFGWEEKRREALEARLPSGVFRRDSEELERHQNNVDRFLLAIRELLRDDRLKRLYQAETAAEPAPANVRARRNCECFVAALPGNELLSQAIDMGFERLYFVPKQEWHGPYQRLPRDVPEGWIELKRSFASLGYEEDRYIFSQRSGLSVAGLVGFMLGIPRTANRLLEDFLVLLKEHPDRFPIRHALELFRIREDRVIITHSLEKEWLNEEQNRALNFFHHNPCTVIWGPPGTGKSTLLCGLVEHALEQGMKVLCSSNTNKAIDSLGEKLAQRAHASSSILLAKAVAQERVTRYGQPTSARFLRNIAYAVRQNKSDDDDPFDAMQEDHVSLCTNYRVLGLKRLLHFDVVILDEVGTTHLPWLYALASLADKKVVVCGDPRQLPPVFPYRSDISAMTRALFTRDIYRINQMRLGGNEEPDRRLCVLSVQHRMPDTLAELVRVSGLYRSYATSQTITPLTNAQRAAFESPPLAGKHLVVLDTSTTGSPRFLDKTNPTHTEIAKLLVGHFLAHPELQIGHITPYRNQALRLRRWISEEGIGKITAGTVHSFQGSEVPLCIWDTVESPPATAISPSHRFTDDIKYPEDTRNLINVAVSRSTMKLIVIANVDYLRDRLGPGCSLHRILDYASRMDAIVPADLALRQMSLRLGEGTPVARNFSTKPHVLKVDDGQSFAAQFRTDSRSSRNKIAVWLKRVELGPLYELFRFVDETAIKGGLIAEMYLPGRAPGRVKDMVKEQTSAKPHLIPRYIGSWPYGEDAHRYLRRKRVSW